MAIQNYTTKISPIQTAGEIQAILVKHGASKISMSYEGSKVVGISFTYKTRVGEQEFALPVRVDGVHKALNREAQKTYIPGGFLTMEHAEKVAWRILKDWINAMIASTEAGLVELDEVLFPYALHPSTGQTMFQGFVDYKLQLEAPKP